MAGALVHRDTPMEYFRGLVEYAVERRRVKPSVHTRFYLVHLLAGFVSTADPADGALGGEALGVRLARALQAGGAARRESLRQVGDASLFISGFFAESLSRRLVDVDYYIALGGRAYGSLGRAEDEASAGVFAELAGRFVDFVDLLWRGQRPDREARGQHRPAAPVREVAAHRQPPRRRPSRRARPHPRRLDDEPRPVILGRTRPPILHDEPTYRVGLS